MDKELTNEQIIERVNAWQNAGFVHPLTCVYSSHPDLIPVIKNDKVILKCPKCKREQEHIPSSILSIEPGLLEKEKQRLISLGANFGEEKPDIEKFIEKEFPNQEYHKLSIPPKPKKRKQ